MPETMRIASSLRDIPGAFESLVLAPQPGQRIAQRNRRSSILAAVRHRIADIGYKRVTNRMIAEDCDLTPQTVYNLIGDKRQLIGDAIVDYMKALSVYINDRLLPCHSVFVVDAFWQSALSEPEFVRQISTVYFDLDPAIGARIAACSKDILVRSFAEMRAQGVLSPSADLDKIAYYSTAANAALYSAWARAQFDLQELRWHLASSHMAVLEGHLQAIDDVAEQFLKEIAPRGLATRRW